MRFLVKMSVEVDAENRDNAIIQAVYAIRSTQPLDTFDAELIPVYEKDFGDEQICECGHPYYRHFDTYDDMRAVGCKYCGCPVFSRP